MSYTQQDIPKKPNDNETGRSSLLVSFANLLDRFGVVISPLELEQMIVDSNINDVTMNSISRLNKEIHVTSFGSAGQPLRNDAIMRFEYMSKTSEEIHTHYCLVKDSVAGIVIDSFSGIEKHWDVYGGAGSWAVYKHIPALPIPSDVLQIETPPVEEVTIIEEEVVTEPINELSDEAKEEVVIVPVKISTKNNNLWQATYKPGLNKVDTVSIMDVIVTDLSGELPDKELKANMIVPVVGKFEKDGQTYYRTAKSVEDNSWYGIPAGALMSKSRYKSNNDDDDINDIYDESTKEKIIKTAARIEGKTKKLFSFGRTN